ncbi:MAG TPA: three-Cys-motif partner protein TcmP, partial [Iamia sp.]|nr:three-Cys-motif partner protein TcmP [Iamia sp.]
MSFFEEPQGAAVFKHALLGRYLVPFVTKTGSRSAGGRVAYLDAFAGAGSYEDGSPGSPSLAIETARALSSIRELRCYFVEADRRNFERLSSLIASSEASATSEAMRGDATEFLQQVLKKASGQPMFALLDPFGLGIPFDDLTQQLLARSTWRYGRRQGPVTEVLVNFVHAGVYRNASKIEVRSKDPVQHANARAVVDRVDATLGGPWWQEIWRQGGTTEERVAAIRDAYSGRVVAAAGTGWRSYTVQVQDSWQGRPV